MLNCTGMVTARLNEALTKNVIYGQTLAMPPDIENIDPEDRELIRSELLRVQEFARLARNAGRPDGPLEIIHQLVNAVFL